MCVGERTRQIPCYYNLGRFDHLVGQIAIYASARYISDIWARVTSCSPISLRLPLFSSLLSLSFPVIVTVLTKALIWGSWLLSMCRHPGCRGNRSKVVSERRRRPLQCSRKTAAQACSWSDGIHSNTHHDTHSRNGPSELCVSVSPLSPRSAAPSSVCRRVSHSGWRCFAGEHQQATWKTGE